MNSDGLDDLVYIDADGNAYLSINQGDGNRAAGKPPTFKRVSSTALIKKTEGKKRDRVVLADIDGDGRADYGTLDDAGNVFFWRNGWIDDLPKYWQYLGKRFTGKNKGDLRGVRFEDVNGDVSHVNHFPSITLTRCRGVMTGYGSTMLEEATSTPMAEAVTKAKMAIA